MGLKTTNYEMKGLGITLPEAYAMIGDVQMDKSGIGYADIIVQATREKAMSLQALETKRIDFVWDRKKSIAECIYEAAKLKKTRHVWNPKTNVDEVVVVDDQFAGWTNDIR